MESIWQKHTVLPEFPKLEGERKTDVVIIGGGMAGLLTAYFLHQKGVDCILLEKGRICQGATAGTTAKITFQHGLLYQKLLKKEGRERAQCYLEGNRLALAQYEKLCRTMDCDYESKDNYVYSLSDRRKLEMELEALDRIGYTAEFCDTLPLPFRTAGAVKFPQQAQFHPLKFAAAIAQGLPVFEHSFVRELRGTTAVTDCGCVKGDKIIVTTHFPFLNKHGSYFLKLYQHRSYVLALEQAQELDGMYVDENRTGMSFRSYQGLLLLGGGSHRTGKQGGNWAELRNFTAQHYPHAKECAAWAAQDCMSLDDMPYIGKYSRNTPELYMASGFHKWGMTGAMLSAMILSDLVQGKQNAFAEAFCPSRSMMKSQLLLNGFEGAKNLLTFSGKRCPHLGCALHWNPAEHSWDCACHGSRFAENGRMLDNPANGDLKK